MLSSARTCSVRARGGFLLALALCGVATLTSCSKKSPDPANTFRVFADGKIKGLDLISTDDEYSNKEASYAYEGLLQYHYLKRPYVLIPDLAEAMPEISKDAKTYTFKIKRACFFRTILLLRTRPAKVVS